jgi:acyl dehydratase
MLTSSRAAAAQPCIAIWNARRSFAVITQHAAGVPVRLRVGDTITTTKAFSAADVAIFAALTGDNNPVHTDETAAAQTQFGRCIAHGMLSASLIGTSFGSTLPGSIYLRFVAVCFEFLFLSLSSHFASARHD